MRGLSLSFVPIAVAVTHQILAAQARGDFAPGQNQNEHRQDDGRKEASSRKLHHERGERRQDCQHLLHHQIALVSEEASQQTARSQGYTGTYPGAALNESARRPNRLSAPVSARRLLPKKLQPEILDFVTRKTSSHA